MPIEKESSPPALPPHTSLIPRVIIKGGELYAKGDVVITQPNVTIGEHLFLLSHVGTGNDSLVWHTVTYGDTTQNPQNVLGRIQAEAHLTDQIQNLMHPGMTFLTTELPLDDDYRSQKDCVIMNHG